MTDDAAIHRPLDRQPLNEVAVVAQHQAVFAPRLEPIVALATDKEVRAISAVDEVIALTGKNFIVVDATPDPVVTRIRDDQLDAASSTDNVVPSAGTDLVHAEQIGDDVVAFATENQIVAVAAFEPVVAAVAPKRIVALATDQPIIAIRSAEDNVLRSGVFQLAGHRADDVRPDDSAGRTTACRSG